MTDVMLNATVDLDAKGFVTLSPLVTLFPKSFVKEQPYYGDIFMLNMYKNHLSFPVHSCSVHFTLSLPTNNVLWGNCYKVKSSTHSLK